MNTAIPNKGEILMLENRAEYINMLNNFQEWFNNEGNNLTERQKNYHANNLMFEFRRLGLGRIHYDVYDSPHYWIAPETLSEFSDVLHESKISGDAKKMIIDRAVVAFPTVESDTFEIISKIIEKRRKIFE